MDVHRPPRVPPGIDRCERGDAVGAGHLVAAEKPLADGRLRGDVRLAARRIAVPDIDLRTAQGVAPASADPGYLESEVQRRAVSLGSVRRISCDVGAVETFVHEVRPLGLGWSHDA